MQEISLDLIKNLITTGNEYYPFHDDFSRNLFLEKCEAIAGEVSFQNTELEFIEATITLNNFYESLLEQIEEDVASIDLNSSKLIYEVIGTMNFNYCQFTSAAKNKYEESVGTISDFAEIENLGSTNIDGNEFSFHDAVDAGIDIINELVEIIHSFDLQGGPKIEAKERIGRINRLIMITGYLVNLKSAFDFCLYEFGVIEYQNNTIKFKHSPAFYYRIKVAAKQRESSKIQEGLYYGFQLFQEKVDVPKIEITKGFLKLSKKKRQIENLNFGYGFSNLLSFYSHLEFVKLSKLGGIKTHDLIEFFAHMRNILDGIDETLVYENVIEHQNLEYSPFKLNRNEFVKSLKDATHLKDAIIIKLIDLLTTDLEEGKINMWKKPFLRDRKDLYFLIAPLKDGHISYLLDYLISNCLSEKELISHYQTHLINDIEAGNEKYQFELIDQDQTEKFLGSNSAKSLIFKLKKIILLVTPCLYSYPLESNEYRTALDQLGEASVHNETYAEILTNKIEELGYPVDTPIVKVITTNHTSLSGLTINTSHIMDEGLLNNYINTGKLIKARIVGDGNTLTTDEMGGLVYYNNEYEFNIHLTEFCIRPEPIYEILNRIVIDEYPISSSNFNPKIYRDGVKFTTVEQDVHSQIRELTSLLEQQYYFEIEHSSDPIAKNLISSKIHFLLPITTNFIALNKGKHTDRLHLLESLNKGHFNGYALVLFHLNKLVQDILSDKIIPFERPKSKDFDEEQAIKKIETILRANFKKGNTEISLSTIELKHDLSQAELSNVIQFLMEVIQQIQIRYYTSEDLENLIFYSAIFVGLTKEDEKYHEYLYTLFLNLVDSLNFNNHHQKARNIAEESLLLSLQIENAPTLGWLCLFKCYLKQNNPVEASFYASLYFTALNSLPKIEEFKIVDGFYNLMLFYRELGFQDQVDVLFETLEEMKLSEYDKQKIKLSYYSSLLGRNHEILLEQIPKIVKYVEGNFDSIIGYGSFAIIPWLSFFYNLKNLLNRIGNWLDGYDVLTLKFETEIDQKVLGKIKATYFPIADQTKLVLEDALVNIFQTSNHHDFAHELGKIKLIAENTARIAINNPIDIDSLLLSGIVINDNYLTFTPDDVELEKVPLFDQKEKKIRSSISNYSKNLLSEISIKKGQAIIWVFNLGDSIYQLWLSHKGDQYVELLSKWSLKSTVEWCKGLTSFYYEDVDYFINNQEQDYLKILSDTRHFKIEFKEASVQELMVCTSIGVSEYPHNLIQFSEPLTSVESHELTVKEDITMDINSDFSSLNLPVTNILSLDWFKANHRDNVIDKSKLQISGWVPIEDEDYSLLTNYEKIKAIISDKYSGNMHSSIIPESQLTSTINVFMAHGEKGLEGFKTVYTHSDGSRGHAIKGEKGVKMIFGTGEIAILFICNSASLSKDFHAQRINSFVNEIIKLGYSAVIAPGWQLSTDIPPKWLEAFFMEFLERNVSLGEAVFNTNKHLAITKYENYKRFYAPTAWAAMHLYGNPNISVG